MREIEDDIFNTIQTYLDRWCRHCPDAHHAIADITGPEEWWCGKKGVEPGGKGCRNKKRLALIGGCKRLDEYEAIERRTKEYERDIRKIIFERVCVGCPEK